MSTLRLPAFDPADVPESNASRLPEPLRAANTHRWSRPLGAFAGLRNFGVNLVRIEPGAQSSYRHGHSRQDEFVYVLDGEVTLESDAGAQVLQAGQCAGFPAGSGDAHRLINHTRVDVAVLVVGDRTGGDAIHYPDDDLAGSSDADGRFVFTRKDGTPY